MFNHYLTAAYRHLYRNRVLSVINIIGLAAAITTFFLLARYISFETSFDNFHSNKDQLYRVAFFQRENDEIKLSSARNFIGLPSLLQQHLPEVTASTGFDHTAEQSYFQFAYDNKNYYQPGAFYQTDENFFKVFPSLLVKGNPATVLTDPHNLVLSQKMASMLFGKADPIGKRIENRSYSYSDVETFVVSGVMTDVPENSHFHLNFIAKNSHVDEVAPENFWTGPRFYTYITLSPQTDALTVEHKINTLLDKLSAENIGTKNATVTLQPITSIHNQSHLPEELEGRGNNILLFVLGSTGILILLCAWINYINIEAGKSITRTKEIGVRAILGSDRVHLALQFSLEYAIINVFATGLSVAVYYLAAPTFQSLLALPVGIDWTSPVWKAACLFYMLGFIFAGAFPALILVGQRMRSRAWAVRSSSNRSILFRKALIAFQFTCSVATIAILMIISDQLDLIMLTNKKIDIENIVSIRNPTVYTHEDSINYVEYTAFQHELTTRSLVSRTTGSSAIPGMEIEEVFLNRIKRNTEDPYDPTPYKVLFIDHDYLPFYQLKLKAGRNYSVERGEDQNWSTILLNESAARAMGFDTPQDAIDQTVAFHLFGGKFKPYKIVGIIEDYHHEASKKEIQPTILSLNHQQFQQVFYSVKLAKGVDARVGLEHIEQTWKKIFPDKPFEFFFQDEYYDRQFKIERRFASVFGLLTMIAILIACLGIVGMTLFETTSRLREVSIRKVLGATISNLLSLLSASYLKLVFLSALCGLPIIYSFSVLWLDNYPLRIGFSIWYIVSPVFFSILLISISAGWQTVKTVLTNPVKHLKDE
jgi:putative ABC transport system permease protein